MFAERIETQADFIEVLTRRRAQLGMGQEDVEHEVGLAGGHLGKIEHGEKSWGKLIVKIQRTAIWLLEFYGLTIMVVDVETARKLQALKVATHEREHLRKESREPRQKRQRLTVRLVRDPE